jgi:hypothetical protein
MMENSEKNTEELNEDQEKLIILYLDILYQDIVHSGICSIKNFDFSKPGVPYPIAKALLKFLESREEYEKCQVIHKEIKNFKTLQKEKDNGLNIKKTK